MTNIVLLSVQGDRERVNPLLDALVDENLDVWWQQLAIENDTVGATDMERIRQARCVILIWSKKSASDEAIEFLRIAKTVLADGNAICIYIDDIILPAELKECTLYDMRGWRGSPNNWRKWFGGNLFLREIVAAAKFKKSGKDPPPPDAARKMFIRQAIAVLPAIGAIFYFVTTTIGLWVDLDLSTGASDEEQVAWDELDKKSCNALRGFVTKFPDGYYADQSQARLDGRITQIRRQWERMDRSLPLYISSAEMESKASRQAAKDLAVKRAKAEADKSCKGLAETGQAKLETVTLLEAVKKCDDVESGYSCSYEGDAICTLNEPRDVEIEICDAT